MTEQRKERINCNQDFRGERAVLSSSFVAPSGTRRKPAHCSKAFGPGLKYLSSDDVLKEPFSSLQANNIFSNAAAESAKTYERSDGDAGYRVNAYAVNAVFHNGAGALHRDCAGRNIMRDTAPRLMDSRVYLDKFRQRVLQTARAMETALRSETSNSGNSAARRVWRREYQRRARLVDDQYTKRFCRLF